MCRTDGPISKQTWCLKSTETIRLIRDGKKGERVMEVGGEGDSNYTYRYIVHHQNDFSIKMGSDESHFNVS